MRYLEILGDNFDNYFSKEHKILHPNVFAKFYRIKIIALFDALATANWTVLQCIKENLSNHAGIERCIYCALKFMTKNSYFKKFKLDI